MCRRFNFEIQSAATDDAILLSFGPRHSFPLETIFHFVSPETLEEVLIQALLAGVALVRVVSEDLGDSRLGERTDFGPHNVGQATHRVGAPKDLVAEDLAVNPPVSADELFAKLSDDLGKARRARFVNAVPELVGVDQLGTQLGQLGGRRRLSRGDPPREPDDRHVHLHR